MGGSIVKHKLKAVGLLALACISLLLIRLFVSIAADTQRHSQEQEMLKVTGRHTTAVVTDRSVSHDSDGDTITVRYSFATPGNGTFAGEYYFVASSPDGFNVGDTIQVAYDPGDPNKNAVLGLYYHGGVPLVWIAFAGLSLVALCLAAWLFSKAAQLWLLR